MFLFFPNFYIPRPKNHPNSETIGTKVNILLDGMLTVI